MKMHEFSLRWWLLPVFGVLVLGPGLVKAEGSGRSELVIEEILVTAKKREQALSDVPMALAAIAQAQIEERGYTNLESFFRSVPSVSLLDGGAQRKQVVIRGIAIEAGVRAESLSSSYVDETLVSGGSFGLDPRIFDMQRVEVLKGPQGTLYGGGSISGSVRYITNKPNPDEFEVNFAVDGSKTEDADLGYTIDGMVNIPLAEGVLGLRLVGFYADNSGYYGNEYLGLDNQGQFDQYGGRVALRWTPADNFSATAAYFVDKTDQSGWYRSTGDDWKRRDQNNRHTEQLTADAEIFGLNMEWDVGWATVTSATALLDFYTYRRVDRTFLGIDQYWDPARLAVLDDTWDETLSEELRIVSAPDKFGPFDWIIGMYYADLEVDVDVGDYIGIGDEYDQNDAGDRFAAAAPDQDYVFPFPEGYVSPFGLTEVPGTYPDMIYREIVENRQKQLAFFGELTYNLSDALAATVGFRRTNTTTSGGFVNQVADAGEPVFSEVVTVEKYKEPHSNWMFNLSWDVNDDIMLFGRAAEGFRVGTGGVGPTIQPSCQELARQVLGFTPGRISSDTMWAYELGTKMTFANGRMVVNAGVYQNRWQDIQVEVYLEGDATCSISVTQNVAAATGTGFEFSTAFVVTNRLQLGLSGGYINFTLDDDQPFLNASKGDRLPSHPDFTLSGTADYSFPLMPEWEGFVRAELSYVGKMLGEFNADSTVPRTDFGEYTLANVRLGASRDKWEFTLYAENLFNKDALTFQFKDRRNRTESLVVRPITLGINVRTKF